jgi:alkylation response protein AidB-like acyl-CoA dehydrogenase
MDFQFSEEQQQLSDAIQRWVDKAYSVERRRRIIEQGGFSREAYAELAELGLCALNIDPAHDGLGLGPVESMLVMQTLGYGLVLEPLQQTLIASAVLQASPQGDRQAAALQAMASGEHLVTLAYQERQARYQLDRCNTLAQADGDGHRLQGTKHLVAACDQADAFIVPAMLDGQLALFLVDANAPGVQRSGYCTQDGSRAGDLTLEQTPAQLLSSDGRALLELAMDTAIALACAQGVGLMDRALMLTVDYLKTRHQFKVPLANFQVLRHRVADMKMQLELARSMSYYATLKLSAPRSERRPAMARAKYQLGQSMRFVGQQSVQLHGGIGLTNETLISHCFKAMTQLELSYGDSLHQLGEVSAAMQEGAPACL